MFFHMVVFITSSLELSFLSFSLSFLKFFKNFGSIFSLKLDGCKKGSDSLFVQYVKTVATGVNSLVS